MSVNEAWIFVIISGLLGCYIMYSFSVEAALISLLEFILVRVCLYAVEKSKFDCRIGWSHSRALPCLIGWVAGFGETG